MVAAITRISADASRANQWRLAGPAPSPGMVARRCSQPGGPEHDQGGRLADHQQPVRRREVPQTTEAEVGVDQTGDGDEHEAPAGQGRVAGGHHRQPVAQRPAEDDQGGQSADPQADADQVQQQAVHGVAVVEGARRVPAEGQRHEGHQRQHRGPGTPRHGPGQGRPDRGQGGAEADRHQGLPELGLGPEGGGEGEEAGGRQRTAGRVPGGQQRHRQGGHEPAPRGHGTGPDDP